MRWVKHGLVYVPDGTFAWALHSALTPTPILMPGEFIRVYAGFRDAIGVSRIGFVDVDADKPTKVLRVSESPALDIGRSGAFDDNGVILGDVIRLADGALRMYFVGFQLAQGVKFMSFTGVAQSFDGGETFVRLSEAPIMDRSDEGLFFRAIHSVLVEDGIYKIWYGCGSKFDEIDGVSYPNYSTFYIESIDGLKFPQAGLRCFNHVDDEYRIGRPRVYRRGDLYHMFYTVGTRRKTYLPGYAESSNGFSWLRLDDRVGITPSSDGWDSRTLSYPAIIEVGPKTFMFYNGNDMGMTGFGVAQLEPDDT
jgi:hypothetical protein